RGDAHRRHRAGAPHPALGHRASDLELHHGRRHDGADPAGGRDPLHATLVREGSHRERQVGVPTHYVAHRGAAAQWRENSLSAFRNAIAGGAQILECDVHLTADGEVAVMHDPTLDRTSSGTGPIAGCTRDDLRRARLRGPDGALTGEHVPTLGEVLAIAAPAVMAMLVEMKTPGPAVRYERRGERFAAVP